jgi:2-hydroxy-6-oxonona-2,4-dienedioate hydrolase
MTATATKLTEEGTSHWIEAGGMKIHYHDVGQGPPLIMLHAVGPGGVTAWITFHKNLPALSQHFRCIAMDMPNFAKTGPVVYNEPVHNLQARTAAALMDALGIKKAHLMGNSQGGQSAMVFASHYPDRVDKLVFGACHIVTGADTYLFANTRRSARFPGARRPAAPPPSHDSIRASLADYIDNDELITDDLVDYLYRMATGRPDLAEARAKSTSTYYDHSPDLPNITSPALIIWGRYDRICPVEVGIKCLNHLPKSRLVVLNDCGHWVSFEKPEEYNAYVLDFLRSDWAYTS